MKVDFNNIHTIKKLGAGLYGTTYLVKYNNKEYALKIQHILEKDIKKTYKNEIWREMSLYNYINNLNKEDQSFFTKLYDYSIEKCSHKQKREHFTKSHPMYKKIIELDKSPWCIKYLTEYKGKYTLNKFLERNINSKLAYSFALQIAKIMLILYKGGYSHNDMHFDNIMVGKTNNKYFNLNNKKIPFYGYQLNVIDYGEVLHKKFGIKYNKLAYIYNKLFLEDRHKWLSYEYNNIFSIFDNLQLLIKDCKKQKKKLPWEGKINRYDILFKKIIMNYTDLYNECKDKYLPLFKNKDKDNIIKLLNKIALLYKTNMLKKPLFNYVTNKKGEHAFWWFYNRLTIMFRIQYPEKFTKYVKWCSVKPFVIPTDELKQLLGIFDIDIVINKLIQLL